MLKEAVKSIVAPENRVSPASVTSSGGTDEKTSLS